MIIKKVSLQNYRGFHSLELELNSQLNVIAGVNGAGKSSLLDCISGLLTKFVGELTGEKNLKGSFSDADIKNGENLTSNSIEVASSGIDAAWTIHLKKSGKKARPSASFENLTVLAEHFQSDLETGKEASIPVLVYYGVNRSVNGVSLERKKSSSVQDQFSIYDQALLGSHSDFRQFFEWFRDREDFENERIRDNRSFTDLQLDLVRSAIEKFTGFTHLKVRRETLRLELKKGTEILDVRQLSEGEKCFLALVGDIARRLAIANPGSEKSLEGEGVILIDEIDLHLHPTWQRIVIPKLVEVFPNCQFIVTTHSPVVISHVPPKNLFVLFRDENETQVLRPEESYGRTADRILEDLMDVPARPPEVEKSIELLFESIERNSLENAKQQLSNLREKIDNDPVLLKAEMLIRSKEFSKR